MVKGAGNIFSGMVFVVVMALVLFGISNLGLLGLQSKKIRYRNDCLEVNGTFEDKVCKVGNESARYTTSVNCKGYTLITYHDDKMDIELSKINQLRCNIIQKDKGDVKQHG